MSDLISRSALLKSYDIAKMVEYDETGCGVTRIAIPVQAIKDAPAVDAVEVVHGRWLPRGSDDRDAGMYYCSACKDERYFGDEVFTSEEAEKYAHYCPNCGAKMDGGSDEKD